MCVVFHIGGGGVLLLRRGNFCDLCRWLIYAGGCGIGGCGTGGGIVQVIVDQVVVGVYVTGNVVSLYRRHTASQTCYLAQF